jgi:hypothetical protein
LAFKDYKNDYPEVWQPGGDFPIDFQESLDIKNIYENILSRNRLLLEVGKDICQIYRRKEKGIRCTNSSCPAYNNFQQNGSNSCLVCFGTGFVNGYDYVSEIYVRFPPSLEQIKIEEGGLLRLVKPRIWTMPEPEIKPFDLLINFSQPRVIFEDKKIDVSIWRDGTGLDFDSLDEVINEYRQVIRILKISDNRNESPDYKEGIDYVLSNNGVLWKTDSRPDPDMEYFVTYQISARYYRRHEVNTVTPSRWRGKTLHQDLEVTELPPHHPLYVYPQSELGTNEWATIYNPFPESEWYERE